MTVLFDLDGTLTDSQIGIITSMNHALVQMGRSPLPAEELSIYLGPPLHQTFRNLLDTEEEEMVLSAVTAYREYFGVKGLFENEVYPGIPELLGRLQGEGIDLYVATSKPVFYARQIIDHFGLTKFFRDIYGSEMDGTRSGKHDLIAYILEQEGLKKEETWMVGDRRHDIEGAAAHTLRSVGVLWGYGSPEELKEAGATHLCTHPSEFPQLAI